MKSVYNAVRTGSLNKAVLQRKLIGFYDPDEKCLQRGTDLVFNLFASGFKWLQPTFAYDTLLARNLNFSTWFTKYVNIPGTKPDLIMD